jgi:hypothetical protein
MALPVMSPLLAVLLALPNARWAPVVIILEVGRRLVAPYVLALDKRGDRSLPGTEGPSTAPSR